MRQRRHVSDKRPGFDYRSGVSIIYISGWRPHVLKQSLKEYMRSYFGAQSFNIVNNLELIFKNRTPNEIQKSFISTWKSTNKET